MFITLVFYVSIGILFLSQDSFSPIQKKVQESENVITFNIMNPKEIETPIEKDINFVKKPPIEKVEIEKNHPIEKEEIEKKPTKSIPKKPIITEKRPQKKQIKKEESTRKNNLHVKEDLNKEKIDDSDSVQKFEKATKEIKPKSHDTSIPKNEVEDKNSYIKQEQNRYYELIKQAIEKHKVYPKVALRRGIQGEVKIGFTLSKDGDLISYEIISGDKIFEKSIEKAMKDSFPVPLPQGVFDSNINLSLTILYKMF